MAYSAILFCTLVTVYSCTKNSKDNLSQPARANPDKIVNAIIAPGQTYVLNVASSGNVSIYQQASHYLLSQTSFDEKISAFVYQYVPASDFAGTDKVVLMHTAEATSPGSNNGCNYGGDRMSSSAIMIAVNITVQ